MNRMIKQAQGVTLLEIMLVLAVAAMVIVMSVRYFQSSQGSHQANETMSQIQAIASGMDNIAQGGAGTYAGIDDATLGQVIGENNMKTVTQSAITIVGTPTQTTYTISMPLSEKICATVKAKLAAIPNIANAATAPTCTTGTLQYTYDSTQS